MRMSIRRRRRIRQAAVRAVPLVLVGPTIAMPWLALQQIQRDVFAPTTWLITLTAAALLLWLVRFIDRAHR